MVLNVLWEGPGYTHGTSFGPKSFRLARVDLSCCWASLDIVDRIWRGGSLLLGGIPKVFWHTLDTPPEASQSMVYLDFPQ